MSDSLLILLRPIAFIEGELASLEQGLLDGLRPGDTGVVFYQLTVGGQKKNIDVGPATVIEASKLGATCQVPGGSTRPGYQIRFELPAERVLPATTLKLARDRLQQRRFDAALKAYLDRLIPEDEDIEAAIVRYLDERRAGPPPPPLERQATVAAAPLEKARAAEVPPPGKKELEAADEETRIAAGPSAREVSQPSAEAPGKPSRTPREEIQAPPGAPRPLEEAVQTQRAAPPRRPMVEFAAGSFAIGLELSEAEFYSQHPRFRINLDAFALDPEMVSRGEFLEFRPDFVFPDTRRGEVATHVTFEEAAGYCQWLSKRLPTEFEWEVAIAGARVKPGLLEWTSSWYKPYPGNDVAEVEYGERFRVLRGAPEPEELDPRRRRFAAPGARHPRLGFRCARDIDAS